MKTKPMFWKAGARRSWLQQLRGRRPPRRRRCGRGGSNSLSRSLSRRRSN